MDDLKRLNVIILAGGFGTRLQSRVTKVPKPLAPIGNRTFLQIQMDWLIKQGCKKITVAAHYLAEQLIDFIEDFDKKGSECDVVIEEVPLGTGGAIKNVVFEKKLTGDVLIVNGDTAYDFDILNFYTQYKQHENSALILSGYVSDCSRFGLLSLDDKHNILSFHQAAGVAESGKVSCGACLLPASLIQKYEKNIFSLEKHFYQSLIQSKQVKAFVLNTEKLFFDIGVPDAYDQFCLDNYNA